MRIPRLYAIADVGVLASRTVPLRGFAEELAAADIRLLQLRYKGGRPREVLRAAAMVREVFAGMSRRLILNDRADLALLAGWDGVHVGQGDLAPEDARRVLCGVENHPPQAGQSLSTGIVGVSTHTDEQVRTADLGCADYIAIGPVFRTGTKADAAPVVGLEGVRRARALTDKPLVAIGGITRENARSVIAAGADSVAVISGLLVDGETVEKVVRDFIGILG